VEKADSIGLESLQVDPVLGGEVEEREQLLRVISDLAGRLGAFGAVGGGEVPAGRLPSF
jgi:hypothetical protein